MSEALLKSYPFYGPLSLLCLFLLLLYITHHTNSDLSFFFFKACFLYFGCYWKFSVIKILT